MFVHDERASEREKKLKSPKIKAIEKRNKVILLTVSNNKLKILSVETEKKTERTTSK